MEYIKKFESFSNTLNPFDMDDIYNYVEFNHPLYCILSKSRSAKLLMMSPKKYFEIISKNFNMSYEDSINSGAVSKDLYMKYAEDMKKGDKFPVPYYREGTSLQEGRHRVLACMELGIEEIPVIEFFELAYDEVKEIAYDLKNKTDAEIKKYLLSKGFDNFTDLDKRELSNVFKYKF
jgi:hypothetical protein